MGKGCRSSQFPFESRCTGIVVAWWKCKGCQVGCSSNGRPGGGCRPLGRCEGGFKDRWSPAQITRGERYRNSQGLLIY